MQTQWTKVSRVECIGEVDDYVYDLSVADADPYFFGNDILLHNTDSCYFSPYEAMKDQIASGEVQETTEQMVQIGDMAESIVNESFPPFMSKAFNCTEEAGSVIKCGREIVASTGLFIKKKRYACMMVDKEGHRYDVDGKAGKIKAMGLDLKRSDTPPVVQNFLSELLFAVLTGANKDDVYAMVKKFKSEFNDLPPWKKGAPSRVNGITVKVKAEQENGKTNMPGHVRASMNWNNLVKAFNDTRCTEIIDGTKVVVCKLKKSHYNIKSIAFPVDQTYVPDWFKELPFDNDKMESTIVDGKVENLLGVLNWDITNNTKDVDVLNEFFTFV